ncbi:TetR/AcrR family transcriptional regulator [Fulvivirga maritima]|uniref:TetR/AcrR family transcriptional regulator n=1 Tax=Fulvivirga maritima TaxID=2904247 RepID=UPI001F2B50F5|nr:TetR/AcrR family transcriptional regulator [Fulvivirga maritima]UII27368.1 TetR/AcrR family transcriptional regulator [Fulvivirga maritima]
MPVIKAKKEDWLQLGLEKFSTQGNEGINVEQLADILNCNKSSFYWHFKTRKAFLKQVINYWVEHQDSVIQKLHMEHSREERFKNYLLFLFKSGSFKDLTFYLQKIAAEDKYFRKILKDYEKQNYEVAFILISDLGYSEEEAHNKTQLLLHFYRGWYEKYKYRTINRKMINEAIELVEGFVNIEVSQ